MRCKQDCEVWTEGQRDRDREGKNEGNRAEKEGERDVRFPTRDKK